MVEKKTLKEWFDNIREIAKSFGAGKSEIKTDDGEWEYIFTVRRLKKSRS